MKQPFEICPCPPSRLTELFRLRATVWLEQGAIPDAFPNGEWRDALDDRRQHWVALVAGEIVGGASLTIHASLDSVHQVETYRLYAIPEHGPIAAPDRVVVRRDWRGRGIVQRLLDLQDTTARAAGAILAVRQASAMLKPLLLRRGWRDHGPALPDARFPREEFSVVSLVLNAGQPTTAPDPHLR